MGMNRPIDVGLKQTIVLAKYYQRTFEIADIRFKIGLIDNISGSYYLAIVISEVNYGDGVCMPAIIVSKYDIRKLLEEHGRNEAMTIIRFAVGHEMGHLQDFRLHNYSSEIIVDEEKEIEADMYSIMHNDLSASDYIRSMEAVLFGMISACEKERGGISKLLRKKMLEKSVGNRIAGALKTVEGQKGAKAEPIYKEIAELLLSSVEIVDISSAFEKSK